MNSHPRQRIVIAGGGSAGWMAAAGLSKFLHPLAEITLVESEEIGIIGVGEATIPQIKHLNSALGIDEHEFLRRTQGTFKLGIEFHNWRTPGAAYLHNFGTIGLNLESIHFHHYWLRSRAEGGAESLWEYCMNTQAARENRFAPVERIGTSPLGGLAYAYHFDAALYAGFLREFAEKRGVRRIEGKIVDVAMHPETGSVSHLRLESGQEIAGDLFIDCTGFRSLLLGAALETPFEDWSHWLRSDRAVAVPSGNGPALRPYTQSIAHKAGWQWRIPLQHRTGNGHVFSSAYLSEDEAVSVLLGNLEGEVLAEPRIIRFRTGRRREFWRRNVIALGLASGFLEPLESTSIHLIQSGISRLLPLLPRSGLPQPVIDEYNRQMGLEFDKIRDFIILHYHANERTDAPFWTDCREMDIPESLQAKIELFRATGGLYHQQEDLFTDSSWLQVLIGQGVYPRSHHPIADRLSAAALGEFLGNIRQLVTAAAGRLPTHEAYIRQVCSSPAAAH